MLKFIAIEGIDGAGLSTQAGKLRDWLQKMGKRVVLTKEPTNGIIGGVIRSCLDKELKTNPLTLQLLYAADRAAHLENVIEPVIKSGSIVVTDRYVLSSLAYGSLDVPIAYLKQLNAPFRKPDATFILDAHPKIALGRLKGARWHAELFENEQKLTQVRQNYLSLRNHFTGTFVIDANKTAEEVALDIQRALSSRL
ncbi:MAG: dTMP kinase [Candidatus Aenigmatarchaeota archaeon]